MAGLAAAAGAIGSLVSGVATIAGGAAQAQGIKQQAAAQQANLEYQAKQLEIKGKEEQAAAQYEAFQKRREKEFALSALQARSAASGFTATDPTVLQIGSDIEKYGTLQEMMASYGGSSRRAGLDAQAVGNRAQGAAIVQGAKYAAQGAMIGSLASGFSKFASGIGSFASTYPTSSSAYKYG
jgi:hypothetical protein